MKSWIWTKCEWSVRWSVLECVLLDNKYVNIGSTECISLLSNFLLLVLFRHLISLFWAHVPYSEYMWLYVPTIFVNYSRVQQLYYLFLHVLSLWWLNAYLHGCSSKVLSQLHSAFYKIIKYNMNSAQTIRKEFLVRVHFVFWLTHQPLLKHQTPPFLFTNHIKLST